MNIDEIVRAKLSQHIVTLASTCGEKLGDIEEEYGSSAIADVVAFGVASELISVAMCNKTEADRDELWAKIREAVDLRIPAHAADLDKVEPANA